MIERENEPDSYMYLLVSRKKTKNSAKKDKLRSKQKRNSTRSLMKYDDVHDLKKENKILR